MNVVLATERTRFDAGAELLAIELAQRAGGGLHMVLPLVGNPEFQIVAPERAAALEEQARESLEQLAERALARGVTATLHVREGEDLWREIVDEAHERHAELLVIRHIGKRGMLARLVVGETISQVAAQAAMPVLLAPEAAAMWSRRVLALVEPQADVAATARIAAQLAALAPAPLAAVVADGAARAQMEEAARAHGVAFEAVAAAGALDASLAARVQALQADLLVLGLDRAQVAHGRLSSAVEALIGAVPCPTVLVKPRA